MARTSIESRKSPDPKPEKIGPPDDVLIYIDHGGALVCIWNGLLKETAAGGARAQIPQQHRVRLEPGLSFCPGDRWELVRVSPSFERGIGTGILTPVAGQLGHLEAELAKVKPASMVAKIMASSHVPTLIRLRELENIQNPRIDVQEALDDRLQALEAKVKVHQRKRRGQRTAHRSVAGGGLAGARPRRV